MGAVQGGTRAAPEGPWATLLERVRGEKLALYLALAAARPVAIEESLLRIGVESEAMRRDLARGETHALLTRVAAEVFGEATRVEIVPMPSAEESPLGRARQREQDARDDPLVQYAVEIFGGEVRGTRERRP